MELGQVEIDLMRSISKARLEASTSTATSQNFLIRKLGTLGSWDELRLELRLKLCRKLAFESGMFEPP